MNKGHAVGTTLLVLFLSLLSACAGTATLSKEYADYRYAGQKFRDIAVTLNSEAQEKHKDNQNFSAAELTKKIRDVFQERAIFDDNATHRVEVLVTDMRLRSTATALIGMFGGEERILATVSLKDGSGSTFAVFDVVSVLPGGGIGHVAVLYDHFARTVAQGVLNGDVM